MLVFIGILMGVTISLIGSFLLSLIPYVPFQMMFLATVIPSILVFVVITYHLKPNATRFYYWLNGFVSLFIIGILAFAIKNYLEARAVANTAGSSLNWDAVIIFNILYSLGAALLVSPVSYYALKGVSYLKRNPS